MFPTTSNRTRSKKIIVIISIFGILILIAGVYTIISMNNTIQNLTDRSSQTGSTIQPTERHVKEVTEINILYAHKQELLWQCKKQADEIKSMYDKNQKFISYSTSNTYDISEAERRYNILISDKDHFIEEYGQSTYDVYCAYLKYIYFTQYVDKNNQILIEAHGWLDMLNNSFSNDNYNRTKTLLNSIIEPNL